jgi:integrase
MAASHSFRKASAQAKHAVRQLELKSQGTERNYEQALKGCTEFLKQNRLEDLQHLTVDSAMAYLTARANEVSQKTLDLDRQAMQAVLDQKLTVVKSELDTILSSRAYTPEQAALVAEKQTDKHSLATQIAENAGLRAHELLTLRPVDERPGDTHREYRADRFAGRECVAIYTVEGKGGLCREVAIDRELAIKLEERRLDEPKTAYDRGIGYKQHYDLGGGKQWSDSFSKAAQRELGWSEGAHGLRHQYAQSRVSTLQKNGYDYVNALEVVSQEMGHFRPDITLVYLR